MVPTQMIQSIESVFKKSIVVGIGYPDWNPVTIPFPKGTRPSVYKGYVRPPFSYEIRIPAWGSHLPPEGWFYGRNGLWHEAFDSIPFHRGDFSLPFLKQHYDKYFIKEISHRLWAPNDGPLNPSELFLVKDKEENPRDYYGQSNSLMLKRRDLYHDSVKKEYAESLQQFMPKEKTLEGRFKGNKRKIESALKSHWSMRDRTENEIKNICRTNAYPLPIFQKGFWVNRPNPNYKKVVFPDQVFPAKAVTSPPAVLRHGRGRRLNSKLRTEIRTLLSKLETPKLKICRDSLRKLRCLDRHLENIIDCSRHLDKRQNSSGIRQLFLLISKVPYKRLGTSNGPTSGSIKDLPCWARRIVTKNIKFYRAIKQLRFSVAKAE